MLLRLPWILTAAYSELGIVASNTRELKICYICYIFSSRALYRSDNACTVVPTGQVISTDSLFLILIMIIMCWIILLSECIHGIKFNSFMQGPKAYMASKLTISYKMHGPLILNARCSVKF